MAQFPQINDDDYQAFNESLTELLEKTGAQTALVVEKAGYLISECGDKGDFDQATFATLASNAFNATQFMVDIMGESQINSMFQQGENTSVLWMNIEENSLLLVMFRATISVGAVKFYGVEAAEKIAAQIKLAQDRDPGEGVDLATLDPVNADDIFKKKED